MFRKIGIKEGLKLDDIEIFFSGSNKYSNLLSGIIRSQESANFILKELEIEKKRLEDEFLGHKSQFTVQKEEKRDYLDFKSEGDLFQLSIIIKMIDIIDKFNNFDSSLVDIDDDKVFSMIHHFMEKNLFISFSDDFLKRIKGNGLNKNEMISILEQDKENAKNELYMHKATFKTKERDLSKLELKSFGDRCHIKGIERLIDNINLICS